MKDGYLPQSAITLHIFKFVGRVQWITAQFHGGHLASWNAR